MDSEVVPTALPSPPEEELIEEIKSRDGVGGVTLAKGEDEEEDLEDDGKLMGVFNVKQPRDIKNGFSHAAQNIARGVGVGLGGLISAPIEGATTNGVAGFFSGIGIGLVGVIAAPTIGIGAGVNQIYRGFLAQDAADNAQEEGLIWDDVKREWTEEKVISLKDHLRMAEETLKEYDDKEARKIRSGASLRGEVKEKELYHLLDLEPGPETNTAEIRKAYYKKAKELHPDKHRGDKDYVDTQFKEVSEAYRVLSDPVERRKYDEFGIGAFENEFKLDFDPTLLYGIVFGAHDLSNHVGDELRIGTVIGKIFAAGVGTAVDNSEAMMQYLDAGLDHKQNLRVAKLAVLLEERLAPAVSVLKCDFLQDKAEGDPKAMEDFMNSGDKVDGQILQQWLKTMGKEAEELCDSPFGSVYVEALGRAYEAYYDLQSDDNNIIDKATNWLSNSYKDTASMLGVASRVRDLFIAKQDFEKMKDQQDAQVVNGSAPKITSAEFQEQMNVKMKGFLKDVLILGLMINYIDVQYTIRDTVELYFKNDTSVPRYERGLRLQAVKMLGEVFTKCAKSKRSLEDLDNDSDMDLQKYLEDCVVRAYKESDT